MSSIRVNPRNPRQECSALKQTCPRARDPRTERFESIALDVAPARSELSREITALFIDATCTLWIARADGALLSLAPAAERAAPRVEWSGASVIRSFGADVSGELLIGADDGLWHATSGASTWLALAGGGVVEIDAAGRVARRLGKGADPRARAARRRRALRAVRSRGRVVDRHQFGPRALRSGARVAAAPRRRSRRGRAALERGELDRVQFLQPSLENWTGSDFSAG